MGLQNRELLSSGEKFSCCVCFALIHYFHKDGRSLRKVAEGGNYSISTLSLALSGLREIKVSTLQEISESLGVTSLEVVAYAQKIFDDQTEFSRLQVLREKMLSLKVLTEKTKRDIAGT